MKSKQEINQWIIKNCWNDSQKYYDLSCLTFDASVTINCMNVKGNIDQSCQVCKYLDQSCQKATTCIDQSNQECGEDLYQNCQKVGGDLIQSCQKVGGDLIQSGQNVKGDLIQDKAKKEILDKAEREYLASAIKPFKDKVKSISKRSCLFTKNQEYIWLNMADGIVPSRLPGFSSGTMYKGMKLGKDYTLKELGL